MNKYTVIILQWDADEKESSIKEIKKTIKRCGLLPKEDRKHFRVGIKDPVNQTFIDLPEEVLKALGQMNPRDVANILVNTQDRKPVKHANFSLFTEPRIIFKLHALVI